MTHLWGGHLDKFVGKKIFSVDEIKALEFDKIVIANQHYKTLEEVLNLGIPEEKIVIATKFVLDEYESKKPTKKIKIALPFIFTPKSELNKIIDEKLFSLDGNYFFESEDYFRIGTLQLLAEEIHNRKIAGDVAELGVNKGFFCKIHQRTFSRSDIAFVRYFRGFRPKR